MLTWCRKNTEKPTHAQTTFDFFGLAVASFGDWVSTFRAEATWEAPCSLENPKTWYCEPVDDRCKNYTAAVQRFSVSFGGCVQEYHRYKYFNVHGQPPHNSRTRGENPRHP